LALTLMAFTAPVAPASSIRPMMSSATPSGNSALLPSRTMPPRAMAYGGVHRTALNRPGNSDPGQLGGAPGPCRPGRRAGSHADNTGGHRDVAHHHDGQNDAQQEREPAQPPPRSQHRGDGQRQADAGAPAGNRPDVLARLAEAGSQVRRTDGPGPCQAAPDLAKASFHSRRAPAPRR
jgi:hypothetical protein